MTEATERTTIRPAANLLHAKSLAIVGASPKGNWPNLLFHSLKEAEFPGNVFLINPNYEEIWGAPCYPSLEALPEPADHLLMLVPTRAVISTLKQAVPLGAKAATIYSAGFGEGTDPTSHERGRELAEFCEESGIVCCGPNCMGAASVNQRMMTYAQRQPLLKPGPVGAVFQSGGSLGNWMKGAAERGVGFSYAISSGNEVSLDVVDYMSFLIDDADTKIIVLMVEGIRRPKTFLETAARALEKDKPIIVVKLGRSEMGKRQAISHTGSLAGDDEVFSAACDRYGMVRCHSLEDLTEMTLAFLPGRRPRGGRAAIVVNSGGMKGILLDHIEEVGIELATLSDASNAALRPLIPDDLVVENPLECGVAGFGNENTFAEIVRIHAEDDGVDLLAIHGELPRFGEKRNPELLKKISRSIDKPVVAHARSTYSLMEESRVFQEASEIPHLQGIKATLRALNGLGAYGHRRRVGIPGFPLPTASRKTWRGRVAAAVGRLRPDAAAGSRGRHPGGRRRQGRGDGLPGGAEDPVAGGGAQDRSGWRGAGAGFGRPGGAGRGGAAGQGTGRVKAAGAGNGRRHRGHPRSPGRPAIRPLRHGGSGRHLRGGAEGRGVASPAGHHRGCASHAPGAQGLQDP